jgi:hypothetical protein
MACGASATLGLLGRPDRLAICACSACRRESTGDRAVVADKTGLALGQERRCRLVAKGTRWALRGDDGLDGTVVARRTGEAVFLRDTVQAPTIGPSSARGRGSSGHTAVLACRACQTVGERDAPSGSPVGSYSAVDRIDRALDAVITRVTRGTVCRLAGACRPPVSSSSALDGSGGSDWAIVSHRTDQTIDQGFCPRRVTECSGRTSCWPGRVADAIVSCRAALYVDDDLVIKKYHVGTPRKSRFKKACVHILVCIVDGEVHLHSIIDLAVGKT